MGDVDVGGDTAFDIVVPAARRTTVHARVQGLEQRLGVGLYVLRLDDGARWIAAQNVQVVDGTATFVITPGTYEVGVTLQQEANGIPYHCRADGRFSWDGEETPAWNAVFHDRPGQLEVVDGDGQPIANGWFFVGQLNATFCSDRAGRIDFDVWPGDRFELQRARWSNGFQAIGPVVIIDDSTAHVVMPKPQGW